MQKLDVEPNKETLHQESQEHLDHEEWPQANSIDLYALASAAGRLAGNLNDKPGALDDFFSKLKILEHEWYESEKRYHKLKIENDRLTNQLIHERTRCAIYQKKLKFIQDNQKNFEKLKEVYVTMKTQESAVKTSIDIQDKSIQTLEDHYPLSVKSTLTDTLATCSKYSLTKYHGNVIQSDSMVSIRRTELCDAQENLQLLKDMIKKREYTWSVNVQREDTMRDEIRTLEKDKENLQALVRVKDMELKALKTLHSENPTEQEENINNMKRIIGKMSRRLRELEKIGGRKPCTIFDDKEKEFVKDIEDKAPIPKRPQMVKPQPMKITTNKSFPTSPLRTTRHIKPHLSTISETRAKSLSDSSEECDSDMQELELLGQIKKSIEEKQAALKEKVQQIINYSQAKEIQK